MIFYISFAKFLLPLSTSFHLLSHYLNSRHHKFSPGLLAIWWWSAHVSLPVKSFPSSAVTLCFKGNSGTKLPSFKSFKWFSIAFGIKFTLFNKLTRYVWQASTTLFRPTDSWCFLFYGIFQTHFIFGFLAPKVRVGVDPKQWEMILRHQQDAQEVNWILILSTWKWCNIPLVKDSVLQACPQYSL